MSEIKDFFQLEPDAQEEVIGRTIEYTNGLAGEQPRMLPLSRQDILGKYMAKVAYYDGQFAGFISTLEPMEAGDRVYVEVGSLWVPRQFRGRKYGEQLVDVVTRHVVRRSFSPIAFCNEKSIGHFMRAGYKRVNEDSVPRCLLQLCVTCPAKKANPGPGCCDTVCVYDAGI